MPLPRPTCSVGAREQRRGLRIPVDLQATICSSSIVRRQVIMTDLSLEGCRIDGPFDWKQGTVVIITIPTLAPRAARVRWRGASSIGLHFADRLGIAVMNHLVTSSR